MNLLFAALDDDIWNQYCAFYRSRGEIAPPRPREGVYVVNEKAHLVAGCSLYPTDGPYVLVTDFKADPLAPARLAHLGTAAIIDGLRTYGALRGKALLAPVTVIGLQKMLERHGFRQAPAALLLHPAFGPTDLNFKLEPGDTTAPEDEPVDKPKVRRVAKGPKP